MIRRRSTGDLKSLNNGKNTTDFVVAASKFAEKQHKADFTVPQKAGMKTSIRSNHQPSSLHLPNNNVDQKNAQPSSPTTTTSSSNSSMSIWPRQQQHHQQNAAAATVGAGTARYLTVPPPSFVIWPPTPTPTSSSITSTAADDQLSLKQLYKLHRGELSASEQYRYALSRSQLKASSRTSALLSGFAMIALVELNYTKTTPPALLVSLAVVTTLLVSVHLLTLLMSTCLLPYIEAHGCTKDSPHVKLKFYIDLSWLFSTCIGLILFLLEIVIIFFVKFEAIGFDYAAWITTAILLPVLVLFVLLSYLIHRRLLIHFLERVNDKVVDLQDTVMMRHSNNHMMTELSQMKHFGIKMV